MKALNYQRLLYLAYDIAATTFVYGRLTELFQGRGGVSTSGSSVTINAVTSGVGTFSWARPGDFIWFWLAGVPTRRTVATVPSPDQITVNTAIDLSTPTAAWHYRLFDSGTGADDGAVPVHFLDTETLQVKVDVNAVGGATTNLLVQIEARAREDVNAWDVISTTSYALAGGATSFFIPVRDANQNAILPSSIRVGLRVDVDAGGAVTDIDVALLGAAETT